VMHQLCMDHQSADARQAAIDGASTLPVEWTRYEVNTTDSRTAVQMVEQSLHTGLPSTNIQQTTTPTGENHEVASA
jgi:hypothetical protein